MNSIILLIAILIPGVSLIAADAKICKSVLKSAKKVVKSLPKAISQVEKNCASAKVDKEKCSKALNTLREAARNIYDYENMSVCSPAETEDTP